MLILLASLENAWGVIQTILGIGGLIFVHELGHFLVGRWCGVRAEVFSIGFGPALAKWQPGETEYRIAPIPLGGYVKFLGEYGEEVTHHEPDSFNAATYPRKAAIMLAGVTMNVIAAFALFAWTFSIGVELPAPRVGDLTPGMPAWTAGLQTGDEVVSVDGDKVLEFSDIANDVGLKDEVTLIIRRDGELLAPMRIRTFEGSGGIRQLGFSPASDDDGPAYVEEESPAYEAGFRTGDVFVGVDGEPTTGFDAVIAAWLANEGCTVTVDREGERLELALPYVTQTRHLIGVAADSVRVGSVRSGGPAEAAGLRAGDVPAALDGAPVASVGELQEALAADGAAPRTLTVRRGGSDVDIAIGDDPKSFAASFWIDSSDGLYVRPHTADGSASPAAAAGIVPGTQILEADDVTVNGIADLGGAVAAAHEEGRPVTLRFRLPDGTEHVAEVSAKPILTPGDPGIGTRVATQIVREENLIGAIGLGLDRTDRWVRRILATLGSLVTGQVSATKLSGPVAIAKMSYQSAKTSFGQYLLFLGMISMNLAVLNLLPIPVLDGGQLAVLTAERIRGRPLSDAFRYYLQMTGLVLLLGLMVFVVANDLRNL